MRVLIGTDVLLYYIQKQEMIDGITLMLQWMERLRIVKYADLSSIAVLTNFVTLDEFSELSRFEVLKGIRPKASKIEELSLMDGKLLFVEGINYKPLLAQLNWLFYNDIDCLVTENAMSHRLAKLLGIDDKVYTIEGFIEKCSVEHHELDETYGVAIQKVKFGTLDYNDKFFNTFKAEYEPYYHSWFKQKVADDVYIAKDLKGKLRGLLKLKLEKCGDDFGNIQPRFAPAKRLKISSLKADFTSQKLGQRFMRIVFEIAMKEKVDEIYVTLFANSSQRKRLVGMIEQWGFVFYGIKDKKEQVYVRNFKKSISSNPQLTFPYCSLVHPSFMIPINSEYASQLLPPFGIERNNMDVEPVKQAIKKVLILHAKPQNLQEGSILLFCEKGKGKKLMIISLGIVENIYSGFQDEEQFFRRCRKRSCFSNNILHDFWINTLEKPIVVEFLYACHCEKSIDVVELEQLGFDKQSLMRLVPIQISHELFVELIKNTQYEKNIVANPTKIC